MLAHYFGREESWPGQDLIGFSDEFDADLALGGYLSGVFPMPLPEAGFGPFMGWWSPVHRGVLPLDGVRWSRSLRQSAKHYGTSVDGDIEQVIDRCADPARPGGWIDARIRRVYLELAQRGIVHSVETRTPAGRLVGGLYGVSIGGLFAGESMFHDPDGRDASKVALMRLVAIMSDGLPGRLLDVQWVTSHLASLGAVEIPRRRYLALLEDALGSAPISWPAPASPQRTIPSKGAADARTA